MRTWVFLAEQALWGGSRAAKKVAAKADWAAAAAAAPHPAAPAVAAQLPALASPVGLAAAAPISYCC
eukprot:1158099-Pelagomonas_calceolata.AAC.9